MALIAAREGWCEPYTTATYRRWCEGGQPAGSEPNMSASIREARHDPAAVLARADSVEAKENLVAATEEAKSLGIFGSPSFIVNGELFWGDDRLEEAARWAGEPWLGSPTSS